MGFQIYKPGQGRLVRISTGVLLALLVMYGCAALRDALYEAGPLPAWLTGAIGVKLTYSQVLPVVIFIASAVALAWMLNWAKFADFLIETEVEMRRVAWPNRSSVIGSSIVVVVTVIIMSLVLFGIDRVLYALFKLMRIYG